MINIKKPSVSAIIPFFAGAAWLEEAIESVILQSYPVLEIIVVNDGSEENIEGIEKKYKRRVIFLKQENKGAAAARNFGVMSAEGDIVAFLDSDDLWEPDKIKHQIDRMVSGNYKWCATGYVTFGYGKKEYVVPYQSKKLCWEHIYNACRIATPTVMVYREILCKNIFAEDMKKGQDIFLWFRLAGEYPLAVIDRPLTKVRKREDFTALSFTTHVRVRADLWRKMSVSKELRMPERYLTKKAYKICADIAKKESVVKENITNKLLFATAWLLFRLDNIFLDIKEIIR